MACNQCGKCCKTVRFELFNSDHEYWARLHNLKIVGDKDRYVEFPIKCSKLKNNKCTIYEERPEMCRRFTCETHLR